MHFQRFIFYLLLIAAPGTLAAQPEVMATPTYGWVLLKPEPGPPIAGALLPFGRIRVRDLRFDTLKLGFTETLSGFKKLHAGNTLSGTVEPLLLREWGHRFPQTDTGLLLVVRRLWIKDAGTQEGGENTRVQTEMRATFEAYLETGDRYRPLLRLDSVWLHTRKPEGAGADLLAEAFREAIRQAAAAARGPEHHSIPTPVFITHLDRMYRQPRLQADALQRGIYPTFRDFLQNTPQAVPFSVEQDVLSGQLIVEERGKKIVLTEVWGYCDGKTHYVRAGHRFYPLRREQLTYELEGSPLLLLQLKKAYPAGKAPAGGWSDAWTGNNATPGKEKAYRIPLQLDMETGRIL